MGAGASLLSENKRFNEADLRAFANEKWTDALAAAFAAAADDAKTVDKDTLVALIESELALSTADPDPAMHDTQLAETVRVVDDAHYDVIVVGGGPAGVAAGELSHS